MEGRSREETISRIVEKIINDIEKGSYDHNPKLTSEHALAAELEVSRFLVRQAFERLQGLGYAKS